MVTRLHKLSIASAMQPQSILNFFPMRTFNDCDTFKVSLATKVKEILEPHLSGHPICRDVKTAHMQKELKD